MNKLAKHIPLKTVLQCALFTILFAFSAIGNAQELNYEDGKKYNLAGITVKGNTSFSEQTIITYSGLRKDTEIQIPGEQISNAIKKLWKSNLFSDIEVYLVNTDGNNAYLEIRLADLPELNEVKITGVKKGKVETVIKENKLQKGTKVTENLVTTTKNYLENKYRKDGFLNAKVKVNTTDVVNDSLIKPQVNMVVAIDKGEKVKVKKIKFCKNLLEIFLMTNL